MMGHKHKMIEAWEPEFLWYREHCAFKPAEVKRIHRRHNKNYRAIAKDNIREELRLNSGAASRAIISRVDGVS